jgi:hypothetical protein
MMSYGQRIITNKPRLQYLRQALSETKKTVGLSDGSTWKARSGYAACLAVAVLDMRGSNPLSRSKRFTRGRSINYKI